jgi:hypothetical protein
VGLISWRTTRISARFGAGHRVGQSPNITLVQLDKRAPLQAARQHHGTVANPYETAHGMTNRLEHAPDLAVTPLGNSDPVPAIDPFAAASLDRAELRHAIVKAHALKETLFFLGIQRAQHPHGVFTLQPEARMHQLVGQLTGTRQKQQAFGIQV